MRRPPVVTLHPPTARHHPRRPPAVDYCPAHPRSRVAHRQANFRARASRRHGPLFRPTPRPRLQLFRRPRRPPPGRAGGGGGRHAQFQGVRRVRHGDEPPLGRVYQNHRRRRGRLEEAARDPGFVQGVLFAGRRERAVCRDPAQLDGRGGHGRLRGHRVVVEKGAGRVGGRGVARPCRGLHARRRAPRAPASRPRRRPPSTRPSTSRPRATTSPSRTRPRGR